MSMRRYRRYATWNKLMNIKINAAQENIVYSGVKLKIYPKKCFDVRSNFIDSSQAKVKSMCLFWYLIFVSGLTHVNRICYEYTVKDSTERVWVLYILLEFARLFIRLHEYEVSFSLTFFSRQIRVGISLGTSKNLQETTVWPQFLWT